MQKSTFILLALTGLANCQLIKNTDKFALELNQRAAYPIYGNPGTLVKVEFTLTSRGESGDFRFELTSDHQNFIGSATYESRATVSENSIKTILVNNLMVPNTVKVGDTVSLTLTAVRTDGDVAGERDSISKTVLFLVGSLPNDVDKPVVDADHGKQRCPSSPSNDNGESDPNPGCDNQQWQVEFHVQDQTTGLQLVNVRPTSRDSQIFPMRYSHENYQIGTKERVNIITEVSCCTDGVVLRAVDVAGVETEYQVSRDGNGSSIQKASIIVVTSLLAMTMLY